MVLEFVLIFILSLLFVGIVKYYAPRIGLIDEPNGRSSHSSMIARGAGIGFYLAIVLIVPIFHFDCLVTHIWTAIAVLLVFIVGVLDDHHDTSANAKFIIIAVATLLLSLDGVIIDDVGTIFGVHIALGWLALPFTIFAIVGFTNALNLIDGLDGLAATISIVILGSFVVVGYMNDDFFIEVVSLAFISALLAFLIFNWYPASIFMGDSGSLTLGFVVSVLAVKSLAYLPAVSILFMAAIPIMDTLIVIIRRKLNGRSVFSPDRCHIHHILRHFFAEDTRKTVFFLGILQVVYSLTGLQLDNNIDEGYLVILFACNTALIYMFLAAMIKRQERKC